MGRRNVPTDIFKFIDIRGPDDCWLWKGGTNKDGIPYFTIENKKVIAYRLVYWLVNPTWDINNSREVLRHQCKDSEGRAIDNPLCCNPKHVIPGTHLENMLDMVLRSRSGLTKDMVYAILNMHREFPDMTHSQIAARITFKFQQNVARQTVTDLLSGNRHRELKNLIDEEQRKIDEPNARNNAAHGAQAQGNGDAVKEGQVTVFPASKTNSSKSD